MASALDGGHRCAGVFYPSGMSFPRPHKCSRKGTVERDGKWWCGIHDPVAKQKKRTAWEAKFRDKMNRERRVMRLQFAAPKMLEALKDALPWLEQRGNAEIVAKVKAAIKDAEE